MSESQVTLAPSAQQQQSDVEYRPIPGFPGYEVGSDGTIWTLWQSAGRPRTRVLGTQRRPMKINCCGKYRQIKLSITDERARTAYVHRLVLEAFIGPCPAGMEACHNDGNHHNNLVGNLRWDTRKNNHADKVAHGTTHRGSRCPTAKLSEQQISEIRQRYATGGISQDKLAKEFGISQTQVGRIVRRVRWEHFDERELAKKP